MKKILILLVYYCFFANAQQVSVDLSTGRNDDGTLMPIDMADSDWLLTKPDGTTCINIKTVVYQKGMEYIRNLIENAGK